MSPANLWMHIEFVWVCKFSFNNKIWRNETISMNLPLCICFSARIGWRSRHAWRTPPFPHEQRTQWWRALEVCKFESQLASSETFEQRLCRQKLETATSESIKSLLASPRAAKGVCVTLVHWSPRVKLILLEVNPQRYPWTYPLLILDPIGTVFHVLSLRSLTIPKHPVLPRERQYEKSRTFDPAIHSTEVSKWYASIKQRMFVVWRHLEQIRFCAQTGLCT